MYYLFYQQQEKRNLKKNRILPIIKYLGKNVIFYIRKCKNTILKIKSKLMHLTYLHNFCYLQKIIYGIRRVNSHASIRSVVLRVRRLSPCSH